MKRGGRETVFFSEEGEEREKGNGIEGGTCVKNDSLLAFFHLQ